MRSETILRATRREACDDAIRQTRRNSRAIAIPAANARNESSAITGTGGHGFSPLSMRMGSVCAAMSMPAWDWSARPAMAAEPVRRTVIMPCFKW